LQRLSYFLADMQEVTLQADETAKKLGNYLKKRFPIGYIRKLFRKNGIRLNGKKANPDDLIRQGDRLQIFIPFEKKPHVARGDTKAKPALPVLFENEELLVIDKPTGIAVHEAKGIQKNLTVLGILENQYKGSPPRLVHRLDQDTSGVLLLSKTEKSVKELERLFAEHEIEKEYLCLVAGLLPQSEGKIDFPLPGREGNPVRALTRFKIVKRFSETTLVRVHIDTGRMHQIRLHFAKLGYPVVMDEQHGDFSFNRKFRKTFGLKRQFLHASKLAFDYRGKKRTWTAPLPADLSETLKALGDLRSSAR